MNEINRLVIATGNTHKTEEIRKLLGPYIKIIEDLKNLQWEYNSHQRKMS